MSASSFPTLLIVAITVAVAGWSGWWWVGASTQETAALRWFEERREEGWVADTDSLGVTGYPNRFDTMIEGLELSDPRSGWAWSAPLFQILSLAYRPTEFILVWPEPQTIASPTDRIAVSGDTLRGSLAMIPNLQLTLRKSVIEADKLSLVAESGWTADLDTVVFATEGIEEGFDPGTGHRIGVRIRDITLSEDLRQQLDPTGVLPATMEGGQLAATVGFAAPVSLTTLEDGMPGADSVQVDDFQLTWGKLDLRAQGTLTADAAGFAEGRLTVRAKNWREMLALAESNGAVGSDGAAAIEFGLGLLAGLSGDPNALEVPLTFQQGRTTLGPLSLGPAPRLRVAGGN